MIRQIISNSTPAFTLQLPADMVGKTIEIIAFEINSEKTKTSKAQKIKKIREITKNSMVDLSSFKFNRDEANNYE
jgi:hypothetical protein